MGHAAVTRADLHRFSETFARGGVGQAGVDANPFHAWINSWDMRGLDGMDATRIAPLALSASGKDFSYALRLDADQGLVLQGDAGYSRKSEHEQASYYYSQPFFKAAGRLTIDDKPVEVTGLAWMDREWSSQPLAPDQSGWDWLALHLKTGEKLMLYRIRQTDGRNYSTGNWISSDGKPQQIPPVRHPDDADRDDGNRDAQAADNLAYRNSGARHGDRMYRAQYEKLDGDQFFSLLGRADRFHRQPCRRRLPRADRLLRAAMSPEGSDEAIQFCLPDLPAQACQGSSHFVSGQPLSFAAGNALSPGTTASCL